MKSFYIFGFGSYLINTFSHPKKCFTSSKLWLSSKYDMFATLLDESVVIERPSGPINGRNSATWLRTSKKRIVSPCLTNRKRDVRLESVFSISIFVHFWNHNRYLDPRAYLISKVRERIDVSYKLLYTVSFTHHGLTCVV